LAADDDVQRATAFNQVAALVHASESNPWQRISGFAQHLVGLDRRVAQELYVPPAAAHLKAPAAAVLTTVDEQRLQALAVTITALLKRFGRWATMEHAQQRTSQRDLELLSSYETARLVSRPFTVPARRKTVNMYVGEWVRCSIYVARLVLLQLGQHSTEAGMHIHAQRLITTANHLDFSDNIPTSFRLASRVSPTQQLQSSVLKRIRGAHTQTPYSLEHQHSALTFRTALVQQALPYGSHFQSPLLSYMAVRCLTRHGAWRDPGDFSSILNRLRYGLRLTLLSASRPEWVLLRDDGPRPTAQSAILATEALRRIREH
jgi:hypothetical protein